MSHREHDEVSDVLFGCLDRPEQEWEAAVAAACGAHPALADALRSRFGMLCTFGMTEQVDRPARIGSYELLRPIGGGTMGTVFLARRDGARELVAVKVLQPGLRFSPSARQRFAREREIAQRLAHPGICAVREAAEADGVPFLAMELVDGESLAAWIRRGEAPADPRRVDAALAIVAGVADALDAAHRAGLAHRDIKPGNVVVRRDGQPVLLDFGLGRDLEDGSPRLTRTGSLLGSPAYLAPEVIRGAPADARSDIYSLGVTLYECLTGGLPFLAPTHEALFHRILEDPVPDPRRAAPGVPRDVYTVLQCAMAKDPDRRYASAAAFADDLRAIRGGAAISVRPPGPWSRTSAWVRRNPLISALVVVLLVGLLSTSWLLGEVSQGARRLRAFALADIAASVDPELGVLLGRRAVELLDHPITVSQLQAAVARYHPVRVFPRAAAAIRSVDLWAGGALAVTDDGSAWVYPFDGAAPRCFTGVDAALPGPRPGSVVLVRAGEVLSAGQDGEPRSLLRGRVLAATVAGGEVVAVVATGARVALRRCGSGATVELTRGATATPFGGGAVLAGAACFLAEGGTVTRFDAAGAVSARVPGRGVAAVDAAGDSFVVEGAAGATWYRIQQGEVRRVVHLGADAQADRFWLSAGGDRLAVRERGMRIRVLDLQGAVVGIVPERGLRIESFAFAADGRTVACGDGDAVVRLYTDDGSFVAALHGLLGHATSLAFSADGEALAVGSYDHHLRIFRVRPGSGHVIAGHGAHVVRVDALRDRVLWVEGDGTLNVRVDGQARRLADGTVTAAFVGDRGAVLRCRQDGGCEVSTGGAPVEVRGPTPGDAIVDVAAARDVFTIAWRSGAVRVFAWQDGAARLLGERQVDPDPLSADYAAATGTLVAAHRDGMVTVVDLAGDEPRARRFRAHDDWIWSVRCGPGGAFLTTSRDNTARLWSLSGERLAELRGHEGTVARGVFSTDGRSIATASTDHTVRIWSRDGQLRQVLRGHQGQVWDVVFARDGESVISGAFDRSLRVWPVSTGRLLELSRRLVDRPLTDVERRVYAEYLGGGR